MLHPRPRFILGLAGGRHGKLPCGRPDPGTHLKRQDPLPGGHLCPRRCKKREWQYQQGQPRQVQDPGQICRNSHGHS